MQSIGDNAFEGALLSRVSLPSSLQSIGDNAFRCSSLVEVLVSPKNANFRSVDGVLFSADGKALILYPAGRQEEEYVVPDGVVEIADWAFRGCSSLSSVSIPAGLQTIGDHAFYGCSSLTSVTLPEGVQTIGAYAFSACSSKLTLYGTPGTVAETFAAENGLRFEAR